MSPIIKGSETIQASKLLRLRVRRLILNIIFGGVIILLAY